MEHSDSIIGFLSKAKKASVATRPPDPPTATDLYRVLPRRRLELQRGERLVELPVLGLLPPPVLGQLALEEVSRGGGAPPAAAETTAGYHLIGLLHGPLWLDIPRLKLSSCRDLGRTPVLFDQLDLDEGFSADEFCRREGRERAPISSSILHPPSPIQSSFSHRGG